MLAETSCLNISGIGSWSNKLISSWVVHLSGNVLGTFKNNVQVVSACLTWTVSCWGLGYMHKKVCPWTKLSWRQSLFLQLGQQEEIETHVLQDFEISLYSEWTWSVLEFLIRSGFKPVSTIFIPQIWMILLFVQGLKIYRCCCKSPSCGFILADCLALVSNSLTGLLTCLLQLTCATGRSTNTCRSSSYRWWCATSTWWSRLLLNPFTAASSRRSGSLSSKLRPSASIHDMSNDLFVF